MAIETTLESIDTSLKMIVTILQSAGAISAESLGTTQPDAAPVEKKTKGKAKVEPTQETAPVVDGDPAGTRYWTNGDAVYAERPGMAVPEDQAFKITSAADYLVKKESLAKKSAATAAQTTSAATTPAKDTPDASTVSSTLPWEDVLDAIKVLNKGELPTQGRNGVLATLKHFGCEGQLVPALEKLNKHAEVLAFVNNLLAPVADSDDLGI